MILVAIYDTKAKTYDNVVSVPNVVAGVRAFNQQMQNIKQYSTDFELHMLGEFKNNETEHIKKEDGTFEVNIKKPAKLEVKKEFIVLAKGEPYATSNESNKQ